MLRSLSYCCTRAANRTAPRCCTASVPRIATFPLQRRAYAVQLKGPRDDKITARTIKLLDADGKYVGDRSLREVLQSYDAETHTLVNLTPQLELPTCRLYPKDALKQEEAKQYQQKRAKGKQSGNPAQVTKELQIRWTVTRHDLEHKLEPGLAALRKGNRLDLAVGTRTRRGAKPVPQEEKQALLDVICGQCNALGKEWKARQGNLQQGVTMYYQGEAPKKTASSSPPPSQASNF